MAIVNIERLIPTIFAKAFDVLRWNITALSLANQDFSVEAAKKGDIINIPKHGSTAVTDVTPAAVPPGGANIQAETVALAIDQWKKTSFVMTEQEAHRIYDVEDYLPGKLRSAVVGLAEYVNAALLAKYVKIYNFASDAAFNATHIDAFATTGVASGAISARSVLNRSKTPHGSRYYIMNQAAEDKALANNLFINGDYGGFDALRTGVINQKYGFQWAMDQQMPNHTAGTASTAADLTVNADAAIGATSVGVVKGAGSATFLIGDVFKFANDGVNTYVVTADSTVSTGQTVSFQPPLIKATVSTTGITVTKSHAIGGLAFHRDAMTIAFREVKNESVVSAGRQITMIDPISRIPMRLTFSPEHYQESWYLDLLFGVEVIRPELATRVAGAFPV